jgi:hypothetical protein
VEDRALLIRDDETAGPVTGAVAATVRLVGTSAQERALNPVMRERSVIANWNVYPVLWALCSMETRTCQEGRNVVGRSTESHSVWFLKGFMKLKIKRPCHRTAARRAQLRR